MNKIKQPVQSPEIAVTRSAFWGTIVLGALMLLVFGYFLAFFLRQEKTFLINISTVVFLLSTFAALISLALTFRGRQQLAANIEFYALSVVGIATISIFQGRQSAIFSVLVISVLTILYLLPRSSRRLYWAVAIVGAIVMWAIEWMNPAWRLELNAATPGPAASILFAIILAAAVLREAWGGSLRTKFLTGVTALIVISVTVLASTNYYNNQEDLTSSAGAGLKSLADSQALAISILLQKEGYILQSFSLNKLVQDRVAEANALYGLNQEENLRQIKALDDQWRAADKANNDFDPLVRAALNGDVATELQEFKEAFPENVEVFVTDKYGANLAATNRTSDYYQADEEWWQAAYNNGQGAVYFGQPEFDESSQTFGLILAIPLYKHGTLEVAGILRTTVNISAIVDILSAPLLGGTAHTDLYLPGDQALAPEETTQGLRPADPEALKHLSALTSSTDYETFTLDGVPSAVSASAISSTDPAMQSAIQNLGWVLIVDQSEEDYLAPIRAQTGSTVTIALIIIALSAALAVLMAQLLSTPITRLTSVAEQIAAGNINTQAAVESNDEIGILANTFNSMTSQLHTTLSTLEQRVADRTRNLALAAEVGRSVSQVRALDVMLKDACELILKEFNLYYVQVYLTDPSGSNLRLEAGTGSVGDQLVGRGHSLPVNANSVNGRAATEKHSVVISDTSKSAAFRQNPLLPETKGEMAVPLIVAGKVVGVLDMQSSQPGALTVEVLPAFEALAGQLAVAIQNANLLAETQQARAQVEAQARRLVRQGWSEHLDAIYNPEQLGFVFDHNVVAPLAEAGESQLPENGKAISVPIAVTGESLGSLVVELDDETRAEQTSELVNVVARQVAQQIENLRLLESSERYRNEAEQASRRLTREGWKSYAEKSAESLQYIYDLNQVRPLNGDHVETAAAIPLKVRDEVVGKVAVQGLDKNDAEALSLANAVAERLGAHIEGLRQYDQTQSALAQSEKLFEASRRITQAADLQELTAVAVEAINIPVINRAILTTFNYGAEGAVESLDVIANWWNGTGNQVTEVGTHYPSNVVRMMQTFISPTPLFFEDGFTDERVDATTMQLVKRLNLRAVAVLPLQAGANQIGVLMLEAEEPYSFKEEEKRLFVALGPQISTVLENRRQFERAQGQAKREATLNLINQKIQSATSVEAVLQIAARELGTALGAPMTVAQLSLKEKTS